MAAEPTFEIGLAMAGAISAGAYSGGVFDFLCEALSEWERAKAGKIAGVDPADVPRHEVCIKVMSGASAGALTGAVGLLALAKGVRPLTPDIAPKGRCALPALYNAWVVDVDLASADGKPDLLGVNDLRPLPAPAKQPPLASVLDASVLDWIAARVLAAPPPAGAAPPPFNWIGKPLHLYMMLTNLRGVPYGVPFRTSSGTEYHVMQCHGDRVHFSVTDLGDGCGENPWTRDDALDNAFALVGRSAGLANYVSASLGSSAFPIALAPREIDAEALLYGKRQWPSLANPITPHWPDGYAPQAGTALKYLAADGGVIDNEPFEYAHRGVTIDGVAPNPRDADSANRAVIMIDPFPEAPDFDTTPEAPPGPLLKIPGQLIAALKNQARFKPDEVAAAASDSCYSRYLIAPRRKDADKSSSGVLATGLLGGFGGFLDRAFRDYDYQLGRYNCQRFLAEYFTVSKRNPIAYDGAAGAPRWPDAALRTQHDDAGQEIRIIPLYGSAAPPVVLLPWPRIGLARIAAIADRIKTRADAVVGRIVSDNVGSSIIRFLVSTVWKAARGPVMDDTVQWMLLKGVIAADQLEDLPTVPADDQAQAVIIVAAALCDTASDYRSRDALIAALDKGPVKYSGLLDAAVAALQAKSGLDVWEGDLNGQRCYVWAKRRPGILARLLGRPSIG